MSSSQLPDDIYLFGLRKSPWYENVKYIGVVLAVFALLPVILAFYAVNETCEKVMRKRYPARFGK